MKNDANKPFAKKPLEGEILEGLKDSAEENAPGNEEKVRKGFWNTIAKAADKVPFLEDLIACYYCALDPKTPTKVRTLLLAALAYFVLPLDAIPDFLVGFGFTDDIAVLWAVISTVKGHLRPEHIEAAKNKITQLKDSADNKSET